MVLLLLINFLISIKKKVSDDLNVNCEEYSVDFRVIKI